MDAEFKELVKKGKKTQQEVDSMIQLANEVQYAVVTRGLKPGMLLHLANGLPAQLSGFSNEVVLQPDCISAAG